METKDTWIHSILNSTKGIQKVAPKDTLLSNIRSRINAEQPIPTLTKWLVAASFAILISLNIVLASQEKSTSNTDENNALINNPNNQLY